MPHGVLSWSQLNDVGGVVSTPCVAWDDVMFVFHRFSQAKSFTLTQSSPMINSRKKQEVLNGNFGAARVQAKRDTLDLTKEILTRDNLRIPNRDDAYERLVEAYNTTTDARLKRGLWDMLKQRKATLTAHCPAPTPRVETIWDEIRETR